MGKNHDTLKEKCMIAMIITWYYGYNHDHTYFIKIVSIIIILILSSYLFYKNY